MSVEQLKPKDILLSAADVQIITGFKSRVSLWSKSTDKDDSFPSSYKCGPRAKRWKLSEIEAWMDQLKTS